MFMRQRISKSVEKFGIKFTLGIVTETMNKWTTVLKDPDGNTIDPEDTDALNALSIDQQSKLTLEWVETDEQISTCYTEWVRVTDDYAAHGNDVHVYSCPDGPIMGIVLDITEDYITLQDPCVVKYSQNTGRIDLVPIFNVARTLQLAKHAVRARQAPAELLIAAYPGFILQNRMMAYQLKPKIPFSSTPELTNDTE